MDEEAKALMDEYIAGRESYWQALGYDMRYIHVGKGSKPIYIRMCFTPHGRYSLALFIGSKEMPFPKYEHQFYWGIIYLGKGYSCYTRNVDSKAEAEELLKRFGLWEDVDKVKWESAFLRFNLRR